MNRFVVITGPTATGKTTISVALAKKLSSEIISADSCQIYKGMDIGTAKASSEEMQGVVHHFIDIAEPDEDYSAAVFKKEAFSIIDSLNAEGKVPIIAGGTGLYINSLVYELDFSNVCRNDEVREELSREAGEKGVEFLYRRLKSKDPQYAAIIAKTDKRRIIRRLEILSQGGGTDYDFRQKKEGYEIYIIGLRMPRNILYERINTRVDEMIKQGLAEEVRELYNKYGRVNALKAIGYKELISCFEGEYDMDEAVRLIKRNTRRFAKRQLTWFNRDDRIKWFEIDEDKGIEPAIKAIKDYLEEKGL